MPSFARRFGGEGIRRGARVASNQGLLLDSYISDVYAAYSYSRRLYTDYTGALIRVREDGGGTEADIGTDANGDLDQAALLAHCGANNGFVVTRYDLAGGGNDLTQATAAAQPKIVNAGTVITRGANSRPCAQYDGTDDFLARGDALGVSSDPDLDIVQVLEASSTASNRFCATIGGASFGSAESFEMFQPTGTYVKMRMALLPGSREWDTPSLNTALRTIHFRRASGGDVTGFELYVDGAAASVSSTTSGTTTPALTDLQTKSGARANGAPYWNGYEGDYILGGLSTAAATAIRDGVQEYHNG